MSACIRGARISWTARTITVTDSGENVRRRQRGLWLAPWLLVFCLGAGDSFAQSGGGVRAHTRPKSTGTAVNPAQASEMILSLTDVVHRPIQVWVRTSAKLAPSGKRIIAQVRGDDAALVKVGQRLRCFSVRARSRMHQGRIMRISPNADGALIEAEIADEMEANSRYLVEIVTEPIQSLSVPNASIIEEEGRRVVYLSLQGGRYEPRDVQTGLQGELYTQILSGVKAGDQVVSIGSFFIDAQTKLTSPSSAGGMAGMDHSSMPGMDHGGGAGK
jgi:multidrug efflux pump subunit AcrA (membrane-fusion protein)